MSAALQALFVLSMAAQKAPPVPVPGVDELKVQQAIERGLVYMRKAPSPDFHNG